jgi:crotonobetainyl-CoA:carnitine CoA-transferase CaiB-like acyl-CoA transferase
VGAKLVAEANAKFRERTTEEWIKVLDAEGVACGPIRFVDEQWEDPQVVANDYIVEFDHTLLGPLRGASPIVRMSATPTRVQRASPALGEHTDEVLRALGIEEPEIERLRAERVVR